jgi:catechol 2,3-dioxygenase-like lactoylglutathione lyase family enzyme
MTSRTFGLTHIALGLRDPKRAFGFYRRAFGMVAVYDDDDFVQARRRQRHRELYVGLRHYVVKLEQSNGQWRETWLTPCESAGSP